MENTVQLTPSDLLIERPFTDPDHVASDSAILRTAAENADASPGIAQEYMQ